MGGKEGREEGMGEGGEGRDRGGQGRERGGEGRGWRGGGREEGRRGSQGHILGTSPSHSNP